MTSILRLSSLPLHFMAPYCLRCGTLFAEGQTILIVKGGPDAKYRTIGLAIDEACLQSPELDRLMLAGITEGLDGPGPGIGLWPCYVGAPTYLQGYAKVSMLDNGVARVGLHRGHVEIWRKKEVLSFGGNLGSYAEGYGMYCGGPGLFHSVTEVRFYDLALPLAPARRSPGATNRFIRGHNTHDRRLQL